MTVFRFIYSPAIGTVPGAVATRSLPPSVRTLGHIHVRAIAN